VVEARRQELAMMQLLRQEDRGILRGSFFRAHAASELGEELVGKYE